MTLTDLFLSLIIPVLKDFVNAFCVLSVSFFLIIQFISLLTVKKLYDNIKIYCIFKVIYMKARFLSVFLSLILTVSALLIPANAYSNREEINTTAGSLLEGIFNGKSFEAEQPDMDGMGSNFGMHFPEFLWVGDTLYSYYIRWANGKCGIGLATSDDCIHFEDKGMIIYPSEEYDMGMSSFAGAWYDNGVFYLTYESQPEEGNADIALATSTDGEHFEKQGIILKHRKDLGWQNYNIGTPDLYKIGDTWYMTFHGYGSAKKDCQIGLAYGKDLKNLTMLEYPIIETSNDPNDPDCGTCGRRDVIYYDGWYYMTYEISTDGGAINRNLGDGLGVPGKYYYDFSGSNWGHSFARSKDFIHWEKAPALLHETYKGNYAFDGPAWLVKGDEVYIYYRNININTSAVRLMPYVSSSDKNSGIILKSKENVKLSVKRIMSGADFKSFAFDKSIQKYRIYDISASKNGTEFKPDYTPTLSIPIPDNWKYDFLIKAYSLTDGEKTEITNAQITNERYIDFPADISGTYAIVYERLPAGDVNGDGEITPSDALLALKISIGSSGFSDRQCYFSDVNRDNSVSASDALLILQYSVKLIDSFPISF